MNIDVFSGWSNGYQFGLLNTEEDEVKQGANYYLGAADQAVKFIFLSSNVGFFVEQIPDGTSKTAGRVACFFAPFIGFVMFPFCAAVKSGQYDSVRDFWSRNKPEVFPEFPRALSERAVQVCNFVAERSGDIMRVAMIVSAVAFAVFVNPSFGIGMLVGLGLEAADNAGMFPRKVSLFMERYLPTVSSIGTLVYGGFVLRVFSLIRITMVGIPGTQMYVQHRVDDVAKCIFGIKGIRLSEYEAPLQNNKQMTYDEIMRILNSRDPFVIDPAHCSKGIISISSLPKDDAFGKLLTQFDRIDWASKYELIKGKLSDDDRFINFLSEQFPNIQKTELKTRFEECIQTLADRDGLSKEQYVACWMREQMVAMLDVLSGETRVKGKQEDLQDVINNTAKIIPYLEGLNLDNDKVEIEDCLIKIAIEGGDYCARGLKRSTNEIVDWIVRKPTAADATGDAGFEMKVRGSLQELRYQIIQDIYLETMTDVHLPGAIAMDVHMTDVFKAAFSLGFFPLTGQERRNVGIAELIGLEWFSSSREGMVRRYKESMDDTLQETIKQVGAIHFANYANQLILGNNNLLEEQKETLTNMIIDSWDDAAVQAKFRRLALVSMGILKKS